MKKLSIVGLALMLVVSALLVTSLAFAKKPTPPPPPPPPKECLCPDVFAPVICSNGITYSNLCRAGCDGATGCVPTGDTTIASMDPAPAQSTGSASESTNTTDGGSMCR